MQSSFPYDVFLSHSSKDKEPVRSLAERLRKDGVKVWFDEWEIKPGDNIPFKIEQGLEHSRVLLLCMSANAFGSDWAQLESGTFRFRDPLNKDRRLIPLRFDDSPIKGSLAQFRYINWVPERRDQEYAKLLENCRTSAKSPAPNLENGVMQTRQPPTRPIGDIWSALRGLLQESYSTKVIKGIVGKACLPTTHIEYTGTYKGPYLDEIDRLVSRLHDDARDRFTTACIQEITTFEQTSTENLAKRGIESDGRVLRDLERILTRFGHDLRDFILGKSQVHSSSAESATSQNVLAGALPNDIDYVRRRRDRIESVSADFETIHAFFFKVCVGYRSFVEMLHGGLLASDTDRERYYGLIKEIGTNLGEIHILEGRLAVAGADEVVCAVQQYRLQATEVNDMLRLQLPCKTSNEVDAVTNELFLRRDRVYKEIAQALKTL